MAPHSLWEHEKTLAFHRLKLLELKRHAELVNMAYAKEVKTPADMTAAELREQQEMRDNFHMTQLRELNELKNGVAEVVNMAYAKEVKTPADHAFREALPPGQMREENCTPAELRELKDGVAELVNMAYAKEVKSRADMTAAELREELERSDKLVACLRAEVKALDTFIQQASSQAGGEDGKSTTEAV